MPKNPWVTCPQPNPEATLRLFCFAYAGGSAALFRDWSRGLPQTIDICPIELPGRGTRFTEPPLTRLMPLVETLTTALSAYLDKPFACFGHSLGGLLSFELARELRRRANPLPRCLFISGRGAPHLPILRFSDGDAMRSPIHGIPDSAFIAELQRLNGTPEIVLQHQELMQLLLPTIRADFELFETYVYQPEPPLDCPIVAFGGLQDSEATKETLEAWQAQTQGYFRLQMFPGNHFFLQTAQALLLSALTQHLML